MSRVAERRARRLRGPPPLAQGRSPRSREAETRGSAERRLPRVRPLARMSPVQLRAAERSRGIKVVPREALSSLDAGAFFYRASGRTMSGGT